jgi:hypothetical protein
MAAPGKFIRIDPGNLQHPPVILRRERNTLSFRGKTDYL